MKMYEVTVVEYFCAAHYLRGYGGKCESMHGHNYRVEFSIAGDKLDRIGMLYDFAVVRKELQDTLDEWDHKILNEVVPFTDINPTAENIAREICLAMIKRLGMKDDADVRCNIWETERSRASYINDKGK